MSFYPQLSLSWSASFGGSLFYTTDNEGFLDTCLMNTCCWGCWSRVCCCCCCCWIGCWLVCWIWPPAPLCGWSLSQRIWLWYWFCECWPSVFLQNQIGAQLGTISKTSKFQRELPKSIKCARKPWDAKNVGNLSPFHAFRNIPESFFGRATFFVCWHPL